MQYEIKIEVVFTAKQGIDWDNNIATQMIRNHLEYTLPYLPWIEDKVQKVNIGTIEVKTVKE
jgi:hypothetical protein